MVGQQLERRLVAHERRRAQRSKASAAAAPVDLPTHPDDTRAFRPTDRPTDCPTVRPPSARPLERPTARRPRGLRFVKLGAECATKWRRVGGGRARAARARRARRARRRRSDGATAAWTRAAVSASPFRVREFCASSARVARARARPRRAACAHAAGRSARGRSRQSRVRANFGRFPADSGRNRGNGRFRPGSRRFPGKLWSTLAISSRTRPIPGRFRPNSPRNRSNSSQHRSSLGQIHRLGSSPCRHRPASAPCRPRSAWIRAMSKGLAPVGHLARIRTSCAALVPERLLGLGGVLGVILRVGSSMAWSEERRSRVIFGDVPSFRLRCGPRSRLSGSRRGPVDRIGTSKSTSRPKAETNNGMSPKSEP